MEINEKELNRLNKMLEYENKLYEDNKYIAGIDEVGRGPLCGPVVTCVVVLEKGKLIEGVNDSKKVSEKKRNLLYDKILDSVVDYSIGIVDEKVIDDINILNATKLAMKQCVNDLKIKPTHILVDAVTKLDIDIPYTSIIKGDMKSYTIACASIIAKVYRDRLMEEYDKIYPEYDFKSNKGYGTKKHVEAIEKYGLTKIHRRSFCKKFNKE